MDDLSKALDRVFSHSQGTLKAKPAHALPDPEDVANARAELVSKLPNDGIGLEQLTSHLLSLCKGLSNSSLASTYYGFVTGGATSQARIAELLTVLYDQNVQAHLPEQSIVTDLEHRALGLLKELVDIDGDKWRGGNFTTGATAGNIQGLALGRESVISRRLAKGQNAGDLGILEACKKAGIEEIKILSTLPHSSLLKAASVVGLGRSSYVDVRDERQADEALGFDFARLEEELKVPARACIVAVSCGEVNTGSFATHASDMAQLRVLCDRYEAWLHVDGAFGLFARLLRGSGENYRALANGADGVELADSIAGDLHKFLNVPYDCGFFICPDPALASQVYQNPNASYLKPGSLDVPSPLNIRAENSTRFRGFAVYSTLIGLGRQAYIQILKAQVDLARVIAKFIDKHPAYELLNGKAGQSESEGYEGIFMVVLFRATDADLNARLASVINAQRSIYVSGTMWKGEPACRIAISNWQATGDDFDVVADVLNAAAPR